jgi:hypothetical protein
VLHWYNYGKLYHPTTRIIARTTTEYTRLSATISCQIPNDPISSIFLEWFLWTFLDSSIRSNLYEANSKNATLEVIREEVGFNNPLAGANSCPVASQLEKICLTKNAIKSSLELRAEAAAEWVEIYLQNATTRFNTMVTGYNFSIGDMYRIQSLCPYETVAF